MLENKIAHAHEIIKYALSQSKKPFVAYSGGKDGLIVAHMVTQHQPKIKMVCETSHTFETIIQDIKSIAEHYNFNVEYLSSLTDEWLIKNPQFLFTSEGKHIKNYCSQRQQRTLKKFQKKGGYDLTFTGRTKYDNNVKAEIYDTKHKLQAHPIRDFTDQDVWSYFKKTGLRVPKIYKTKFGEKTGNSPFYSMGYKNKGLSIDKCWEAVNEIDTEMKFYNKFNKYITKKYA